MSEERPPRATWQSVGPTWRWIAGGALLLLGGFITWWAQDVASNIAKIATTVETQARVTNENTLRIAVLERTSDERMERVDKTLDRLERKIDNLGK